jgi:hypothetical protein
MQVAAAGLLLLRHQVLVVLAAAVLAHLGLLRQRVLGLLILVAVAVAVATLMILAQAVLV